MNAKRILLAERRERLIAQAAAQRLTVAQTVEPWRTPLARVDKALTVLRYVKYHPAWIIGGGLLLAALRPARLGSWLGQGWMAWKILQKLRDGKRKSA